MTWAKALRTTTQRAACSTIPRQLSVTPEGWCQVRLHHQTSVPASAAGRLWARKAARLTRETGALHASDSSGAVASTSMDSDQNVYQVWTNRNCSACRGVYRLISRGVKPNSTWIIEKAQANCCAR